MKKEKKQKRKEILIVVQRMNERTMRFCSCMSVPTVGEFDALNCIELDEQHHCLCAFCDVPSSSTSSSIGSKSSNNDDDGDGTAFPRTDISSTDSLIAHPPFAVALLN